MEKKKKTDPTWNDQLINIGMSQKSIDDMTFHPGDHDFFIKMNDTFKDALISDVRDIFIENNDIITKNVAKLVVEQDARWGSVITNIMRGIESVADSVRDLKNQMVQMKADNEKVHRELKIGLRNTYIINALSIAATATFLFFFIRYAHNHWWTMDGFLSFLR